MSFASLYVCTYTYPSCPVPFKVSTPQRTAKKFLRFKHPTAKNFLRFYHATAKKFLWFPGLKLKRPTISRKKSFFLRTQKEVLARALFLGCTVVHAQSQAESFPWTAIIDLSTWSVQNTCFGEILRGPCGTLLPPGLLEEVAHNFKQLSQCNVAAAFPCGRGRVKPIVRTIRQTV